MILNAKGISLPDNITAKVKRKDKKDYIELEYPDAPSITDIKNHSVIQGKKVLIFQDILMSRQRAAVWMR